MKEIICSKADEIALRDYGLDFYELSEKQQTECWTKAEQEGADYLASLIDATREREKEKEKRLRRT